MNLNSNELIEYRLLEDAADSLLKELAIANVGVNEANIRRLDQISSAAAKISYGSGKSNVMSEQMRNLLAWCDHLDNKEWTSNFLVALRSYPLISPF